MMMVTRRATRVSHAFRARSHPVWPRPDLSRRGLTALSRSIDAASPWTAGHSDRVAMVAVCIGRHLGLAPATIDIIHRGSLVHDLGKVGIPKAILDKSGRLTPDEIHVMRSHVDIGADVLAGVRGCGELIPVVRFHHERWDGSGYPDALLGQAIPLTARVVMVADVFDALTSDRPYRPPWSIDRALQHVERGAGRAFDPEVVAAFIEVVARGIHPA